MNTIIHSIQTSFWEVTFVIGIIVGGIVWVAMALWDTIRGLFRRVGGEMDSGEDGS